MFCFSKSCEWTILPLTISPLTLTCGTHSFGHLQPQTQPLIPMAAGSPAAPMGGWGPTTALEEAAIRVRNWRTGLARG
jgi:hypothetical protein